MASELLSPAGNWKCARAAVANGADAIFFGMPRFNARMRAASVTEEDLPKLMEYLHGILQDLGLARLARGVAPQLALHASTQMTLTSPEGLAFIHDRLHLDRAVLARELELRELERFRATTVSLEVFVHGALCVAYSGQCLTSESLGQRSANRGECAQACRMPSELIVDGVLTDLSDIRYLLSPQDLSARRKSRRCWRGVCAVSKSPEYVAAVMAVYCRALDAAMAGKSEGTMANDEDRYALEMTFSRGAFSVVGCTG